LFHSFAQLRGATVFRYGLIVAALVALTWSAHSHDYKRPALDGWYSNLHRKGLKFGCCSEKDCHTTEAELRKGEWWARLGRPVDYPDDRRDWVLQDWVRVPDELIVRGENGLPVPNPAGEAVLCHNIVWRGVNRPNELDPNNTTLFCFVPGIES